MNKSRWRGARGEWYVIIQFIIFALILFGPQAFASLPLWSSNLSSITRVVGMFVAASGALLVLAGILNLGRNLTPLPYPRDGSVLIQAGAYRLVRHPIYSGLIFLAVGWAITQRSTLILLYALLLLVFFDWKSRQEEAWLRAKFDAYAAYQQRVRKLIPFIY